jgi:hypothetical protein
MRPVNDYAGTELIVLISTGVSPVSQSTTAQCTPPPLTARGPFTALPWTSLYCLPPSVLLHPPNLTARPT